MPQANFSSRSRRRLCVCYIITTILIGSLVYALVSNSIQNNRTIKRLRDEMDDMAHIVLHGSVSTNSRGPAQLTEFVDSIVRKRIAGVLDDVYYIKKQMKSSDCSSFSSLSLRSKGSGNELAETRINYASEEIGAKIEDVVAEPLCGSNFLKNMLGLEFSANPPVLMIRQSMTPSNCFAFKEQAEITVKLAREIYIDFVEVEHISRKYLALTDSSSAPKAFELYGVNQTSCDCKLLGKFQYNDYSSQRAQHFPVVAKEKYQLVRFKFLTNAGNPNYTCVYRVGVYGNVK